LTVKVFGQYKFVIEGIGGVNRMAFQNASADTKAKKGVAERTTPMSPQNTLPGQF
jgi:hypothetical protein